MKTKSLPAFIALLASGLAPCLPGADTPAPAQAADKPAATFQAVAVGDTINIRGQATINSERVGQVKRGDVVIVLDTIQLAKPASGEPATWYKIALPAGLNVWASSLFLDTNAMTVKPKLLNLRGGPGENFSVLGRVEKGTALKAVSIKGDWIEVEPPAGAYAFVAAEFFKKQEPPPAIVAAPAPAPAEPAPAPPPPAPAPVVSTPAPPSAPEPVVPPPPAEPVATLPPVKDTPPPTPPAEPATPPAAEPTPPPVAETPPAVTPATPAEPLTVVVEPPPRRIVTREGFVRYTLHLNKPSWYQLESPDSGKIINYLFCTNADFNFKTYQNHRVLVTGEEAMDKRWKYTPVLTIDKIEIID